MTEVERARDILLVEIADTLCKILRPELPMPAHDQCEELAQMARRLDDASTKQHDEDRNGIRPPAFCEGCSTGYHITKPECVECLEAQARKAGGACKTLGEEAEAAKAKRQD